MKTIVINIHSFIDVITNSSTELFVLDTKKALELVRDVIKEKEKEFPPEYGHYVSVDYAEDWELKEMFGYVDENDAVQYLKALGYTVVKPKDPAISTYITVKSERGGMDPRLKSFIEDTFGVIRYDFEA